jgi:hypothetical protein
LWGYYLSLVSERDEEQGGSPQRTKEISMICGTLDICGARFVYALRGGTQPLALVIENVPEKYLNFFRCWQTQVITKSPGEYKRDLRYVRTLFLTEQTGTFVSCWPVLISEDIGEVILSLDANRPDSVPKADFDALTHEERAFLGVMGTEDWHV